MLYYCTWLLRHCGCRQIEFLKNFFGTFCTPYFRVSQIIHFGTNVSWVFAVPARDPCRHIFCIVYLENTEFSKIQIFQNFYAVSRIEFCN